MLGNKQYRLTKRMKWAPRIIGLASISLVLTATGFGIHIGLIAKRNPFLIWLIIGFPYLIASVLLFNSRLLSRKTLTGQQGTYPSVSLAALDDIKYLKRGVN